MRIKNVDFPRQLLEAQKNGTLVVFAGAGVSIPPPSNYPNFDRLADTVADGSLARDSGERVDHFLGRLKDRGVRVHEVVHRLLSDENSRPNHLHRYLLRLFESPSKIRIVTTNFDLHFTLCLKSAFANEQEPEIYSAPALPLGSSFSGIVHLHGSVAKPAERLILTDSDFGNAYLADGWATRFLQQLFQNSIILFVGYSHNDIVIDYLARGLPPESKSPRRYALAIAGDEAHWKRLGVAPISYPAGEKESRHAALALALEGWGKLIHTTALDHEERVKSIVQQPVPLDPDEQDYIEESCKDPSRLQFFTRHATKTDWLQWVDSRGLLENVFAGNPSPRNVDEQLAFWFARNFACDHPNESLATVHRHNDRVSFLLWNHICWAFHSKKPVKEVVAKWVPILLATAPQKANGDWLEYMLCAREFAEEKETILLLVEYLTEIRADLTKKTWPNETTEDIDVEFKVRGSEYWLRHAWHGILLPNLVGIADRLLLIFTSHILRAYAVLRSFQYGAGSWDKLSGPRVQIESSAHGGPPDSFDLVIDMTCEALKSSIANHPSRADFFIDTWLVSGCRLLRRLAVFGVAESLHWSADRKIEWLLENKLVHAHGYKPEVFLLLKKNFSFASETSRVQVLAIAATGPDVDDQRTADYEIYNILSWLKDAAPDCARTAEAYKSFKNAHPEFGRREHPELDWWIGGVEVGGPSSPLSLDQVLALTPDQMCKHLDTAKRDDMIGPSREGLIQEIKSAVSKDYEWSARLVEKLISDQIWDQDVWRAMVWGWQGADLEEDAWKEVLTVLLETPNVAIATVYEACQLLGNGIEKASHPIPKSCFELAIKLAESLWRVCEVSYEWRPEESNDWLAVAINHPAGNLVLFLLRTISELRKAAKDEWQGIPDSYKSLLTTIANADSYSAGVGRVILASQLYFLFTSDREWAIKNVIPMFSFSQDTRRTIQVWHGFLGWGSWSDDILPFLMKHFREIFPHLRSAFDDKQRHAFCGYLAGIACRSSINPIDDGWLRHFLAEVTTDERAMWAASMSAVLQGMPQTGTDNVWKDWIAYYWQSRLDGVPVPLDPAETKHMATWPIRLRDGFAEAAEKLYKSPIPKIDHCFIYEELSQSDLLTLHPKTAAVYVLFLLENRVCKLYYFDPILKVVEALKAKGGTKSTLLKICQQLAEQGYPAAGSLRDDVDRATCD
jgi:hypothetical protein